MKAMVSQLKLWRFGLHTYSVAASVADASKALVLRICQSVGQAATRAAKSVPVLAVAQSALDLHVTADPSMVGCLQMQAFAASL